MRDQVQDHPLKCRLELFEELERRGDTVNLSPGLLGRDLIEEALQKTTRPTNGSIPIQTEDRSEERDRTLRYLIQQTRNDLATVAKALLIHSGGIDPVDVDRWIEEEL